MTDRRKQIIDNARRPRRPLGQVEPGVEDRLRALLAAATPPPPPDPLSGGRRTRPPAGGDA